jgi:hypothetical protein
VFYLNEGGNPDGFPLKLLFPFLLKNIPDLLKNANPLDGIPEKDYAQAIKNKGGCYYGYQ